MKDRTKDTFMENEEVASFNECTGLMPFLPETIEEDRKLSSLYGIHSASKKREKHGKK